jgi:hypothetical protein
MLDEISAGTNARNAGAAADPVAGPAKTVFADSLPVPTVEPSPCKYPVKGVFVVAVT